MSKSDIDEIKKKLKSYYDSINSIPELQDTITKVTQFLKDCEENRLIKFPNNELKDYFEMANSRARFNILSQYAHVKIIAKQNHEHFIPKEEWVAFQKITNIDAMRTLAEELKVDLKVILDPVQINPDKNELGTYLNQIYNKCRYDKTKQKEMSKIFKVDLRNALSHLDYELDENTFTWNDRKGIRTTWTNEELKLPIQQMSMTTNIINEKINEIKSQNS